MNLVFEKLAQSLAAGAVWRLNIGADFFRVVSADWALKVRILKAGRILGEMDGWQAGDYLRGVEFDAVEIENGATAQIVTVQIAGGGVGSDRVIGEVSVIDGGMARTKAGIAFLGHAYLGTTAGNIGHVQLWNPVGSGKRLILEKVEGSVGTASSIAIFSHDQKLIGGSGAVACKKIGGAAGVAEVITYQNAAGSGTVVTGKVSTLEQDFRFIEPLVIEPGKSVGVRSLAGVAVNAIFEFYEDAIQ